MCAPSANPAYLPCERRGQRVELVQGALVLRPMALAGPTLGRHHVLKRLKAPVVPRNYMKHSTRAAMPKRPVDDPTVEQCQCRPGAVAVADRGKSNPSGYTTSERMPETPAREEG